MFESHECMIQYQRIREIPIIEHVINLRRSADVPVYFVITCVSEILSHYNN